VLIYVDTSKQVGDKDHLKVFATKAAPATSSQKCWGRFSRGH
jgi:hypothetical protein